MDQEQSPRAGKCNQFTQNSASCNSRVNESTSIKSGSNLHKPFRFRLSIHAFSTLSIKPFNQSREKKEKQTFTTN